MAKSEYSRKKPKAEVDHITADILRSDNLRLMDYPRRNMSKLYREFTHWILEDKTRAKALLDKNVPVEVVISLCNQQAAQQAIDLAIDPIKKALREVLAEQKV